MSTPNLPSSVVMTSLMVRASTTTESVITGAVGLAHIDGVDSIADGAEVAVPPVGVQPELGGGKPERHPAYQGRRPAHVTRPDLDRRVAVLPAKLAVTR